MSPRPTLGRSSPGRRPWANRFILAGGWPRTAARRELSALVLAAAALPAAAATVVVEQVPGRQFRPAAVVIQPGDTVEWRNADTMPHTVTSGAEGSPDGRFDSRNMDPGQTFSFTFAGAGTYPYYCDYHSGMVGTVHVSAGPVVRQAPGRRFDPPDLTVAPGETVTWVNVDTMPHTATSGPEGRPDGRFDSRNMNPGQTFAYTFPAPGTYPYYCDYHSGMVGQVTVTDALPEVVLHLVKSGPEGADVLLTWSGGAAPYTVRRGEHAEIGALPVYQSGAAATELTDPGVVPIPPSLYYQVE